MVAIGGGEAAGSLWPLRPAARGGPRRVRPGAALAWRSVDRRHRVPRRRRKL